MGNLVQQELNVTMLGLDSVGKASMVFSLVFGHQDGSYCLAHMGVIIEAVRFGKVVFTIYCVSGIDRMRRIWPYYYDNIHGIIMVIDSVDDDTFDESRDELWNRVIKNEKTFGIPLIIFANKQDKDNSTSIEDIAQIMGLWRPIINADDSILDQNVIDIIIDYCSYCSKQDWNILNNRKWKIFGTSAITLNGVYDGLQWLVNLNCDKKYEISAKTHKVKKFG